jgi:hypothetical protein
MDKVFGGLNCTAGLVGVISFYKAAASMIVISGLCGIVSTVLLWLKKSNTFIRIFYTIWCAAIVGFSSWLFQLNLIG